MKKSKLSKAEQLAVDVTKWTAKRDAAIKTLIKATEMLKGLERRELRLLKRTAFALKVPGTLIESVKLDDDMPVFCDRTRKLQAMPDPKSKERKAERREVAKEVRQAELTGKRRRMPLTGKAAFAEIAKGD